MSSQVSTQSFGARSRSRSSQKRSRSASRSPSRTLIARPSRGPSLRTNGDYKMTRMTTMYIPYTNAGFILGATNTEGFGLVYYPDYVQAVSTTTGGTITSNVHNYPELAALWDRVYLERVDITMTNKTNDPSGSVTTNTSVPNLFLANDFSDVLNNSLNITLQAQGLKTWHAVSNLPDGKFSCKPHFQQLVYYSATLPSSYNPSTGFVVSNGSIPHYGTRIAMDTIGVGAGGIYFMFNMHYRLRDVK